MNTFFSRLENIARQKESLLCVGLDPHPQDLPGPYAMAARDFCLRLIEATHSYTIAYKPNAAFFEALGPVGWLALGEVIAAVPDGIPVLLDAKRGDIASTAEAYASSAFLKLKTDAITINPYLGKDSIDPFIQDPARGVFLLCKTSNPGAADLQDLPLGKAGMSHLYEYVAHLAQTWNENDNVGLVVGATQVDSLRRVREAAQDLWFLAPGVGAQGGDPVEALQAGLRSDGLGMLVPVSRGISRAEDPGKAARSLRDTLNQARASLEWEKAPSHPAPRTPHTDPSVGPRDIRGTLHPAHGTSSGDPLAESLLTLGCVRFGEFTLKSGLKSPIYVDLRRLVADPAVLQLVAQAFVPLLEPLAYDLLAPLPYAALPIGTAVSLEAGRPLVYPRKEVKAYGTKAVVEGIYEPGQRAVVIDDLISTGGSKLEGIEKLKAVGLEVQDVAVLIDRQAEGVDFMGDAGYTLHSVFKLTDLLDIWEESGQVEPDLLGAARKFLAES